MSTRVWKGDAPAVAQVTTATPANVEIGDTFSITINGRTVSFVATAATVANVTAGLVAAWNLSTVPEHEEVTATDSTTHVTLTADTAGKPFTASGAATNVSAGTDDQTLTLATPTASSGPNDWATAANWSGGAVPVNSDDVVFENSAVDVLYSLDQNAVTLTSLIVRPSYTGRIGLPRTNTDGSTEYLEYRETVLKISATAVTIDGGGGRIKLNTGTAQTLINVNSTGTPAETDVPTLLWVGTHASNVLNVNKGSVGVAFFAGETATIATHREGYLDNVAGDAAVVLGPGCTLTTILKSGGQLEINSNVTTLTQTDGETVVAAGAMTTLNLYGGQLRYRSAGTYTTLSVFGGAEADFRGDLRALTGTNTTLYAGAILRDPNERITFTNPAAIKCGLDDLTLDLGTDLTLARG